jgi:hypothetical protein
MRSFKIDVSGQMLLGRHIKEDEMGGTCSLFEREEMDRKFWCENLKKRGHLERNLGMDEVI